MFVLDTNVVIAALNGVEPVAQRLAATPAREVVIPTVVIGELVYGARRSAQPDDNIARARSLWQSFVVVPVDERLAATYGTVRAELAARGTAKSDFDLIIACSALERGATLVTHDASLKDGTIRGLRVEDWLA